MSGYRPLFGSLVGLVLALACTAQPPAATGPSSAGASAAAAQPAAAAPPAAAVQPAAAPPAATATTGPLTRVSVAVPVPVMPFLPFYVAKQKGFDRANGLEIEFQTLAGTPSVQALVAGGLDFSTSAGSIVNASLNGAPVTVLMISIDKSAYTIFAGPEIRDVQALRGKTVAVNAVGGSQHSEAILGLSKAGVNVDDVRFVGLPGDALVAAFDSGAVDAGVVLTPQDLELEKLGKGFHKLLNLGDYAVGINGGLGSTTARLQAAPAVVDGMVAASLMGLRYVVENREGTIPLIQEYLQVDAPTAARIYDDNRQAYSDGRSTRETRREIVEHAAESLKLPPPAEEGDAFDFGPLDRAARQLENSGWRAR